MGEFAPDEITLIGQDVGNYKVIKKVGEGGMGAVYLAEHPLIGKKVALKVLHPEFVADPDVVARFFTEAKAVNDIQHPNIVDIVDYGTMSDRAGNDVVYFIMEYLAGEAVADLIKREAPLPPERAFAITNQIADALASSHAEQIVHRDLKPENVYLISRGRRQDIVKVLDFGIAKLTGDQPGSRRTRTGIVIGTPSYMSPEQCEGKGNVDHRTDIYALGIMLYEMLTGQVPFDGAGYGEILVQHITQVPPRPTTLTQGLSPHAECVCMRALEKQRENRYATMEQFIEAMTDPVGFVDRNGGVDGFLTGGAVIGLPGIGGYQQVAPEKSAPVVAPSPDGAPVTGQEGTLAATPAPQPVPQEVQDRAASQPGSVPTDDAVSGEGDYLPPIDVAGKRSKLPAIIGVVVVAAAVAVGGLVFLGGGDERPSVSKGDSRKGGNATSAKVAKPDDTQPPAGTTGEGRSGSEAVPGAGSTTAAVADKPVPKVDLEIVSTPPGAEVFYADETSSRGRTPYTLKLDRGDDPVSISVKLEGYKGRAKKVVPDKNRSVDLVLVAVKTAEPDRESERRKARRDRRRRDKKRRDARATSRTDRRGSGSDTKKTETGKKKRERLGDDILAPDL